MAYSSMAVRILTSPKPLGEKLANTQSTLEYRMAASNAAAAIKVDASTHSEKQNQTQNGTEVPQKKGITFANQDSLPKLPVPDLESTCKKYLAALEPPAESKGA
jgi:Choline/Carnitine o-acyltransferase.